MTRTHTIPVAENEDSFEAIEKWMKKNRYKKEVRAVVKELCVEVSYIKNGHTYFIQSQLFNENNNTVEFTVAR